METKYTQGPWDHNGYSVEGPDGRLICNMSGWKGAGVTEANARLIAAAPDLLDACQAMIEWDAREQDHAVDFYARLDLCRLAFDKARAAIAKAEGR